MDGPRDGTALISIVIPALNAAATLGEQLEALCGEPGIEHCEIVIADNGSDDDTAGVAKRYASRLDVRVLDASTSPGRSAVRNAAVRTVGRDFVAFLDADDVICPGWLAAMVRRIPAPVVRGAHVRTSADALAAGRGRPELPSHRGLATVNAGNLLISREAFNSVGGFNEQYRYRVDVELSVRLHLAGVPIVAAEDACILYRERGSARGAMRQQYNWEKAAVQLQRDYGDRIEFRHSSRNSLKHWALLVPHAIDALRDDEDRRRWLADLGALSGRLVGSLTYRTLFL